VRVLVVSSFPPRHCGIGAYAAAQVDRLRRDGHHVEVLSPPDGRGDVRLDFRGGRPFLRAARIGGRFDRIVVHFQPLLYYRPRRPASKIFTSLALWWLVLRRPAVEILVHEADRPSPWWRPDYLILRFVFARASLAFHTGAERLALERAYRVRVRGSLVPHVDGVAVHAAVDRRGARDRLGLDPDERLTVCAGFLHPAKGYERAVHAFAAAGSPGRLCVIGSVRDETPENLAYARTLRALCERTPGATFLERYLADEEFDLWVAAADAVVLPYRSAWSSGALARAQALGTPALVAAVGGLAEQATAADRVFSTDDDLSRLLAGLAPGPGSPGPAGSR
jgi:glycosyltransferase involved in cell wall biosynthesis